MKILLIADVHNRPSSEKSVLQNILRSKTLRDIEKAIKNTECDLIVFMGDTVHGPDLKGRECEYEHYLREVLDLTGNIPFAYIFGNHDDECGITKQEILDIVGSYPNSVTDGRNYIVEMMGEQLLFIDSGSYYEGDGSFYDTVKEEQIAFAKQSLEGKTGILFQHIIVPDIMELIDVSPRREKGSIKDGKKYYRFRSSVKYSGVLGEAPCPPDINTGELECLKHCLKAMCFGHDHKNSFELDIDGVRLIQCAGASYNSYDKLKRSSVKLLDTRTLKAVQIFI